MGGPWSRYHTHPTWGPLVTGIFFAFQFYAYYQHLWFPQCQRLNHAFPWGLGILRMMEIKENKATGEVVPRGENRGPLPQLCGTLSFEKTARTVLGSGWSQLLVLFVKWD